MHEAGMSNIKEFNKVKAHVEAGTRSWKQVANEWADHYANKGRLLHDQPTEAMLNDLKFQVAELSKVVQLLIHVVTLWPSQGKSGRLPKRVRVARLPSQAATSGFARTACGNAADAWPRPEPKEAWLQAAAGSARPPPWRRAASPAT